MTLLSMDLEHNQGVLGVVLQTCNRTSLLYGKCIAQDQKCVQNMVKALFSEENGHKHDIL